MSNKDKTKKSYSLSSSDILRVFDGRIKILTFKDIENYMSLEELLHPWGRVVILFERKPGVGHWVCLFKGHNNKTYFFDPYGIKPENQLKYSLGMNRYLKQRKNTLNRLFNNRTIFYNDIPIQKWKTGINTCGRWVIFRMMYPNLSNHDFCNIIKENFKDPDEFITNQTNKYLTY